jgi:dihydroflavonol-4-reductase
LERYILGNEFLSFKALLTIISRTQGKSPPKLGLPKLLLTLGGWGKEMISRFLLHSEPYPSREAVDMSIKFMYCSSNKARRELGYNPKVSIEDSVQRAYDWYMKTEFQYNQLSRI